MFPYVPVPKRSLSVAAVLAMGFAITPARATPTQHLSVPAVQQIKQQAEVRAVEDQFTAATRNQDTQRKLKDRLEQERIRQEEARAAALKAAKEKAEREAEEKRAAEAAESAEDVTAPAVPVNPGSARDVARQMVAARGWDDSQFQCVDNLWRKESNWRVTANNPRSGAYGIPQALPGSKMSSHGADWRTNPGTQIAWGLDYIAGRYGTPCAAWAHSRAKNWY